MDKRRSTEYSIIENICLGGSYYQMAIEGFPASRPGQFVNILCQTDSSFMLRRPFCVMRVVGSVTYILYKVIGGGTRLLTNKLAGEVVDVLGPLGNGFQVLSSQGSGGTEKNLVHVLVGGGIGIAPLVGLADSINCGKVIVCLGGRSKEDVLCEELFRAFGCEVLVATDDGSYGRKGFVTELLGQVLSEEEQNTEAKLQVYTCGPKPMMAAVSNLALKNNVDCQVSLEEMMGCGLGGCVCCVCATKYGYQKVCCDGPIFNSGDVVW